MKPLSRALSGMTAAMALSGVLALPAQAEETKIGYVNLDRIMRDATPAKAAQSKLEGEFSRREKELGDMGNTLKAASDKFERDAPTLSESQRNARQKTLLDQQRDFERKRREFQEDLTTRRNEELQQVIERANRALKQVAEAEKFDLIVQDAAHFSPRVDITDKVLKVLNAGK